MKLLIGIIFSALLCLSVFAEETENIEERQATAQEMVEIMDLKQTLLFTMDQMFDPMIDSIPDEGKKEQVRGVLRKFTLNIVNSPELMERMSALYAESFTTKELKEILAFYKTPTGQKVLKKTPELFMKSSQIGQEIAEQQQEALQRDLEAVLGDE